ncbi:hypothetical protein ACFX45_27745, partial [Streptomyces sp. YIM B13518]
MTSETRPDEDGAVAPPGRRRPPGDRVALRGDLRSALPDAGAAVVVTALVFALLWARMESGASDTVA